VLVPLTGDPGELGPEVLAELSLHYGPSLDTAFSVVRRARRFLVASQEEDGGWRAARFGGRAAHDAGVSGLALLALQTAGSSGEERRAARKAALALAGGQAEDGHFGDEADSRFTYSHAVVTRALARWAIREEAVERLSGNLSKAAAFISAARSPSGGWRYGVAPPKSDTSVTFFMVAALAELRRAGIEVDEDAMRGGLEWVKKMTSRRDFTTGYTKAGEGSARPEDLIERFPRQATEALTAASCLVRYWCGEGGTRTTGWQLRRVEQRPPSEKTPDLYYWYAGAEALVAIRGKAPPLWYRDLLVCAVKRQVLTGAVAVEDPWTSEGGEIYSTAMTALAVASAFEGPPERRTKTASGFVRTGRRTVAVPPTGRPVATGIYLDEGMELRVDPEGEVTYWPGYPPVDPGGTSRVPPGRERAVREARYGGLVGRVGVGGKPFAIRKKGALSVSGCGPLFLFVNETAPAGAEGDFRVTIELLRE
jgi:hypothetical protein